MREISEGTPVKEAQLPLKETLIPLTPSPPFWQITPSPPPSLPTSLQMMCVWCSGTGKIPQLGWGNERSSCTAPHTTCNMCHGTGRQNFSSFSATAIAPATKETSFPTPSVTLTSATVSATGSPDPIKQYVEETFLRKEDASTVIESFEPLGQPFEEAWEKSTASLYESDIGYGVKELRERYSSTQADPVIEQNIIPEIPAPQEDNIPKEVNLLDDVPERVRDWRVLPPMVELRKSKDSWTSAQQKEFYKTIARMSLNGPQLVPFVHGGYLYRPEPKPPLPLSDLAESVIAVAETKIEPKQKKYSAFSWEKTYSSRDKVKFPHSTLFQDVLDYSKPNKSLDEVKAWLANGKLTLNSDYHKQRAWVSNTAFESSWYKIMQNFDDNMVIEKSIPADGSIVENISDGVLEVLEQNSNKSRSKEYYTLPVDMEDILQRCAAYKDNAFVTVHWNDIKTVVNKLGDQAPVDWQQEVSVFAKDGWAGNFGYATHMWELRDAKQTMLDLGSMWNVETSCDLTDKGNEVSSTEKSEEKETSFPQHIDMKAELSHDWKALSALYPNADEGC
jgi:hypothetical protein